LGERADVGVHYPVYFPAVDCDRKRVERIMRAAPKRTPWNKGKLIGAQVCDRGTALAALAAVELVVRDLTP
jgi:hypothetical protein